MDNLYIFDTETTGVINSKFLLSDARQPRIVQYSSLIPDDLGNVHKDYIIKPDGWTVPEEAAKIHGFTTEICEKQGIPMKQVLDEEIPLILNARRIVAHNIAFDFQMLCIEMYHYYGKEEAVKLWKQLRNKLFCTMMNSKNIVKIPAKWKNPKDPYKWPTLMQTYKHFFNEEFSGAHNASDDTKAAGRIYYHLVSIGAAVKPIEPALK